MQRAPIALFTYNRPDHTRRTVEALAANDLARESDLSVFSDAPRTEGQRGVVQEVREYLRTINGFRSITVVERTENLGLAASIIDGVSRLVNEHGRVIVLEDDLVTSPWFLRYMNDALELYRDDERVISVNAYIVPVDCALPETFFLRGADCWGWATWKRGWDLFEPDGSRLLRELSTRGLSRTFNYSGSYNYMKMLEGQVRGDNDSWAIRWYASAFLANKLTLNPGRSLVRNIGNDASGTHSGFNRKYDVTVSPDPVTVAPIPVEHNAGAYDAFVSFYRSLKPSFAAKLSRSVVKRLAHFSRSTKKGGYRGNYASWQEALRDSGGYSSETILMRVREAMRKVRDGEAVYERDSVVFDTVEYSWPLLSALLWIASRENNRLRLIDFGGSLGSSYFQNRTFLAHLSELRWKIVEQPAFVACGKEEFSDGHLGFFSSMEVCLQDSPCDAILFASTLPYLVEPYGILEEAMSRGLRYIVIDRTPMIPGQRDRLTVQVVPPTIYSASYPAWFFGEERLVSHISRDYELVASFDSLVPHINLGDITAKEKGYIFKRKDGA